MSPAPRPCRPAARPFALQVRGLGEAYRHLQEPCCSEVARAEGRWRTGIVSPATQARRLVEDPHTYNSLRGAAGPLLEAGGGVGSASLGGTGKPLSS